MATDDKSNDTTGQAQASGQPRTAPAQAKRAAEDDGASQSGVAAAQKAVRKARTTVEGHPDIDARLDNRAGADRPPLESFPAKPQQIDGPDVAHQVEHTAATMHDREKNAGERKGMSSPGPHGLGDTEAVKPN